MSREIMQQALDYIKETYDFCVVMQQPKEREEQLMKSLEAALAQPEPVGFYVYKPVLPRGVTNINAENLPWVYDQAPSSGYMARMFVYAAPPKREQEPVCDKDPFYCWSIRCQVGKVCKHAQLEQAPQLTDAGADTNIVRGLVPKGAGMVTLHQPVAWMDSEGRFSYFKGSDEDAPLYSAPPNLAQPEQAAVPFPSFMRRRIEQAMKDAIHPTGMSVYDGKVKVLVSDLNRMLLVIDSVLAQPKQEPCKCIDQFWCATFDRCKLND